MTKIQRGVEHIKYKKRKLPIKYTVLFFVLVLFFVGTFSLYLGFYKSHWHNGFARSIVSVVPLPVASVEGETVWYKEVIELSLIFDFQDDSNHLEDAFDKALEIAIDRRHLEQLADDLSVSILESDVLNYEIKNENEFLTKIGWSEKDYRKYIVRPLLISQAVESTAYSSLEHQKIAHAEIESIKENVDLGVSFIDLAKQYSDDSSSVLGGDVGYFKKSDFGEGLESIFDLEVGEVSEILEAEEYFVIAKVYDVILDENKERDQVGVYIITVDKNDLSVVLEEYKKGREVKIFVK